MWKKLRQPLSGLQMLAATVLALLAGGVAYGLYFGAAALWHRHRLISSIPNALTGVRKQRDDLVALIERYRAHFGFYPPMTTFAGPERGKSRHQFHGHYPRTFLVRLQFQFVAIRHQSGPTQSPQI